MLFCFSICSGRCSGRRCGRSPSNDSTFEVEKKTAHPTLGRGRETGQSREEDRLRIHAEEKLRVGRMGGGLKGGVGGGGVGGGEGDGGVLLIFWLARAVLFLTNAGQFRSKARRDSVAVSAAGPAF